MKTVQALYQSTPFKGLMFAAILLLSYEFLEHWDDFKAGLMGEPRAQAAPHP